MRNSVKDVILQGYGYVKGLGSLTTYDLMLQHLAMKYHPRNTVEKIILEFEKGNLVYTKSHDEWFCRYDKRQDTERGKG